MYIGSSPNFGALDSQTITSANGSTATFTLNQYVPDSDSIIVTVGNVVQEPTEAYTASGNSITFTENVPNGDTIVVRYLGRSVDVYTGYKRVQRFKYVATNGQQTFSGNDSNSRSLEYTAQDIDIFYNGVRLDESEFTASNGSSVILGTGATTNAELVILAYKVVQLADVVPASSGGTFTGNVVFSGNATVNGNLTASGTTTLVDTTNTVIKDNLLGLNHGASSNSNDAGIIIERGSTGNDALLIWDESADKWALGTTTSNASSTGNLNMTTGTLVANLEGVGTLSSLTVDGDATFTGANYNVTWDKSQNALEFADDAELRFGNSNDLIIRHTGSHSQIRDDGTGKLKLSGSEIQINNQNNTENMFVGIENGAVELSHNGNKKVETTTNGISLNNTTVSGNTANAKLIINSNSQYDGIALGTGASNAVISGHSNGCGMQFTANASPANMGGGEQIAFKFSSGSAGGGGPSDILTFLTDGKIGFDVTPKFNTGKGFHFGDDVNIGFGTGTSTRPDFQVGYDATNTRLRFICGTGSDDSDLILTTGGRLGIGTTNTTARLNIQFAHSASEQGIRITPDGTTATMIRFDNSGGVEKGSITTSGSSTAYNSSSDYRLKENVSYNWDATSRLKQLKPARFNWIDDDTNTLVDGFLAHEVSSIVPESITGDKDEVNESNNPVYQSIDQSKLVPLLVKTIQELEARIETLEKA